MADTPETIYLIPGEDVDGAPCMVWCDDPAPSYACNPAEAVRYVRAGTASAIERDTAFRQRDLAYKQRDEAELIWSKARKILRDMVDYAECNDPGNPHLARAKGFLSGGEQ